MRRFIIAESEADFTSHAGLGLIGMALERYTDLAADAAAVGHCGAMLCLGKSDFEAINSFREDAFFHKALGLEQVPSEGTLRQRMDAQAEAFRPLVERAAVDFLRHVGAPITPLANGLVPLDCDVTPLDNGKTRKEGVSRSISCPRWVGTKRRSANTSAPKRSKTSVSISSTSGADRPPLGGTRTAGPR